MTTELPVPLAVTDVADGSDAVDVVVVGFGIAGGCAALEAARAGARVVVLERAATYGGTSAMSGGHFYLGGGTAVQQATGHADTADEMYTYLMAVSRGPGARQGPAFCDDSVEHFDWLESLGFEFERSYYPDKAVIQPGTEGLMFTGNEKVWPFRDLAVPAPRGHKVPVPGDTEGTQLVMDLLDERLAEAGVEVRYETGASTLVVDDGRGGRRRLEAVRGDRRAAGERGGARGRRVRDERRDGRRAHPPARARSCSCSASTYDDGLGIRLGASVGARAAAHGPGVHHRAVLPAVAAGHRDRGQPRRATGSSPRTATTRARPAS